MYCHSDNYVHSVAWIIIKLRRIVCHTSGSGNYIHSYLDMPNDFRGTILLLSNSLKNIATLGEYIVHSFSLHVGNAFYVILSSL